MENQLIIMYDKQLWLNTKIRNYLGVFYKIVHFTRPFTLWHFLVEWDYKVLLEYSWFLQTLSVLSRRDLEEPFGIDLRGLVDINPKRVSDSRRIKRDYVCIRICLKPGVILFASERERERERVPIKWKSLIKYISQDNIVIDNDDQSTWIKCLWMNARIIYYKVSHPHIFLIIPFSEEQKYFQSLFNYRMIFARTNKGIDTFHFHTKIILV